MISYCVPYLFEGADPVHLDRCMTTYGEVAWSPSTARVKGRARSTNAHRNHIRAYCPVLTYVACQSTQLAQQE